MRHVAENLSQRCSMGGPQGAGQNPDRIEAGRREETPCLSPITSAGPGVAICAARVPFSQGNSLRLYSLHSH